MNDFFVQVLTDLAVKFVVSLIERVGTSDFVSDVCHGIYERAKRVNKVAALKSALQSLPWAVESRLDSFPGVLPIARHLFGDDSALVNFTQPFLYVSLFNIAFCADPLLFRAVSYQALQLGQPVLYATMIACIATVIFTVASAYIFRNFCTTLYDRASSAPKLWAFVLAGAALTTVSNYFPVFATKTLGQHLALNWCLPIILAFLCAWYLAKFADHRIDTWRPSSRVLPPGKYLFKGRAGKVEVIIVPKFVYTVKTIRS